MKEKKTAKSGHFEPAIFHPTLADVETHICICYCFQIDHLDRSSARSRPQVEADCQKEIFLVDFLAKGKEGSRAKMKRK